MVTARRSRVMLGRRVSPGSVHGLRPTEPGVVDVVDAGNHSNRVARQVGFGPATSCGPSKRVTGFARPQREDRRTALVAREPRAVQQDLWLDHDRRHVQLDRTRAIARGHSPWTGTKNCAAIRRSPASREASTTITTNCVARLFGMVAPRDGILEVARKVELRNRAEFPREFLAPNFRAVRYNAPWVPRETGLSIPGLRLPIPCIA